MNQIVWIATIFTFINDSNILATTSLVLSLVPITHRRKVEIQLAWFAIDWIKLVSEWIDVLRLICGWNSNLILRKTNIQAWLRIKHWCTRSLVIRAKRLARKHFTLSNINLLSHSDLLLSMKLFLTFLLSLPKFFNHLWIGTKLYTLNQIIIILISYNLFQYFALVCNTSWLNFFFKNLFSILLIVCIFRLICRVSTNMHHWWS